MDAEEARAARENGDDEQGFEGEEEDELEEGDGQDGGGDEDGRGTRKGVVGGQVEHEVQKVAQHA